MYNSDYYTTAYLAVEGVEKGMTPENPAIATIIEVVGKGINFNVIPSALPGIFEEEGGADDSLPDEETIDTAALDAYIDFAFSPVGTATTPLADPGAADLRAPPLPKAYDESARGSTPGPSVGGSVTITQPAGTPGTAPKQLKTTVKPPSGPGYGGKY